MTNRCEPPPELRGVDGWHWVTSPRWTGPDLLRWRMNSNNLEFEWLLASDVFVSSESQTAKAWRYIAPVATPAEVDALRAERDDWKRRAGDGWQAASDESQKADVIRTRMETLQDALDESDAEITTLRARVAELEAALRKIANSGIETFAINVIGGDDISVEGSNRFAHERDVACIMAAARAALEGKPHD